MDWLKRMNTVLDYIDDNLDGDIKDDKIAALFASSKGTFQRVFSIITEMTLAEYIRKRKLTQAAVDIRNTDAKIIDIAVKYGYDSARSFSSAFKSFHGITPSKAKISGSSVQLFNKFTFALTLTITGGNDMQSRIIENPEDILQKIGTMLEYEETRGFVEELAAARKDNKWGFINKAGKVVITFEYENTGDFSEGYAAVKKDDKWGFIDKKGEVIIPFEYDELGSFTKVNTKAKKDGKWGIINKANETVIPFEYNGLDFSDTDTDFVVANKNGKIGALDINGKVIVPFGLYSSIGACPNILPSNSERYVNVAKKDGETESRRCGFIDKIGKVVIPLEYNRAGVFLNGHAWVNKDGQFSYVDKRGGMVLIEHEKDASWEIFDQLIPLLYNVTDGSVSSRKGSRIVLTIQDGKSGLTDYITHKIILPIEYDEIRVGGSYIIARKDGEWGIIDSENLEAYLEA